MKYELTPIDRIRRIVAWAEWNDEVFNSQLPTLEALMEAYDMTLAYGLDCIDSIRTGIEEDAYEAERHCRDERVDPKPYMDFIRKHDLPDSWKPTIEEARQKAVRDREAA